MSLLELSVVIVVLLALISIMFMGARAWKRNSDRAANIMNIRNTQQAMRSHENMRVNPADDTFDVATLELYMPLPSPPNDLIEYDPYEEITPMGVIWLDPNAAGDVNGEFGPSAGETDLW